MSLTLEEAKKRIVVPLDFSDLKSLDATMAKIYGQVSIVKIGLESLTAMGSPQLLLHMAERWPEVRVFYDGKFKDIGNTLGRAAKNVAQFPNVLWMNVFADASENAIGCVVENAGDVGVLGLTILTDIDDQEANRIYGCDLGSGVRRLARRVKSQGGGGLICSPADLGYLPKTLMHMIKVTPGVRPEWAATNDQKRVMTPGEAMAAGADYLVIGRPITNPPAKIGGPREALQLIAEEIVAAAAAAGK